MILITAEKLNFLKENGLDLYAPNRSLASDFSFEPPCSLKFTSVEQGCSLGAFSYIVSGFLCGVDIGRYCSFGENVQIGRQNHPMDWLSTSPFLYLNNKEILSVSDAFNDNMLTTTPEYPKTATQLKKTVIKNDVWVGQGVIINAGVTIENGAIIGAGSVVTKNVPAYAIVGGNPAKIIRYRFPPDIIIQLQHSQWWRYSPEQIKNESIYDITLMKTQLEKLTCDIQAYEPGFIYLSQLFN